MQSGAAKETFLGRKQAKEEAAKWSNKRQIKERFQKGKVWWEEDVMLPKSPVVVNNHVDLGSLLKEA